MIKLSPLIMEPAIPVSLMKRLAIPLGRQKTATKWLVISPTLSQWKAPLLNPLDETTSHSTRLQTTAAKSLVIPQAGEEANEKSSFQSQRAREQTNAARVLR